MNSLWTRLKAAFFLVLSPFFIVPAVVLTWYRAQGNVITMDPFFEFWIWGAALAGLSGVVVTTIIFFRGR